MQPNETWDDRYPLLNHKYLHYGLVRPSMNWTAGVDGPECVILATGGITVTLPDAEKFHHMAFYIKNANFGGNITIARTGGADIDGVGADKLLAQNESVLLVSDGTNWWILADA